MGQAQCPGCLRSRAYIRPSQYTDGLPHDRQDGAGSLQPPPIRVCRHRAYARLERRTLPARGSGSRAAAGDTGFCQDIVGRLNAAEVIGLGVPAGIPVVIGGADSPCASLACGVIRAGDICQSVGTTNVLTICIEKPVFSKAYLNRCHVIPGVWIYQGATSNGGLVVKWAREVFSKDLEEVGRETGRNVFELMHEEAARSCAGANGVSSSALSGGRALPGLGCEGQGACSSACIRKIPREDMLRAVLESVCYSTRQLLEIAEATSGRTYDQIDTVGGGAKSRIWTQMKADILGRTMRMMELPEAAVGRRRHARRHGRGHFQHCGRGPGAFPDARPPLLPPRPHRRKKRSMRNATRPTQRSTTA